MRIYSFVALSTLLFNECFASLNSGPIIGGQYLNLQRLKASDILSATQDTLSQSYLGPSPPIKFTERYFTQPFSHFEETGYTFKQRYWVNDRHYKKGGPVIVLDSGETSGVNRLPFLDTGIVEILANATRGLGVVLEHRYYGKSVPTANLSTDSLRWLNNAEAAADSARFMSKIKFEEVEDDLTAPGTPWIYYGGSYAGARAAHMKILYPDLVFGAIASSGVTHATLENWEYFDIIRQAAEPECSLSLQRAIQAIDTALSIPFLRKPLKGLFGLADLKHDDDFVSLLESPLGSWQAKNWDPTIGSVVFDEFCLELTQKSRFSAFAVAIAPILSVPLTIHNYARYIKKNYVSKCAENQVEDCFGSHDDEKFQDIEISESRAWLYQVCTEWGYFATAPPDGYPRIISRRLDLSATSRICAQAYPPGEYNVVPFKPNISAVNVLGDFAIAADRLAIIDGEVDPWRPDTPHSSYAQDREDTKLRPFKLIPNGVHHYDEFGLANISNEPPEILKIHLEMIDFVTEWLKEWDSSRRAIQINKY